MSEQSFVGKPAGPFILNPGTGPVDGATAEQAASNIPYLLLDSGLDPAAVEVEHWPEQDENGRFFFRLKRGKRTCEVEMPGLPLEQVRYVYRTQDIWNYPRLYVGGASWVWFFAIRAVNDQLGGEPTVYTKSVMPLSVPPANPSPSGEMCPE